MQDLFVPYAGEAPACLNINGHKLIFVASTAEVWEEDLAVLAADHVQVIEVSSKQGAEDAALNELAESAQAGVVMLPQGVRVGELIENLQAQLPWLQ